ncbi:DUF982 domain-containing protein [Sinorhizobium americanum]|uniref:Uncharacterized protein n=1 Tax=Sinorhizobium americanum TaxID=194963 RepID=A0A1L3LST7_9HYPH|nr:DUF982 domain-containing protein [Sinorhizobium americanum]APG93151.1 hypothetical protein SAMCFNEI73_pA0176 [Sinorhizobium americanum]OAP45741.1 hypothetical protein ATC00_18040 [Sinorhizobium americanum]
MQDILWDEPVKLGYAGGRERWVRGPQEALQCLSEWPSGGGWFYERAKIRCHAALEANGDLALSRHAFVAAAIDASIECD